MANQKSTITVKTNYSKRTFTIRKTYEDGTKVKYRTNPMSKEDFESEQMNTENDWKWFLRSDDYYRI